MAARCRTRRSRPGLVWRPTLPPASRSSRAAPGATASLPPGATHPRWRARRPEAEGRTALSSDQHRIRAVRRARRRRGGRGARRRLRARRAADLLRARPHGAPRAHHRRHGPERHRQDDATEAHHGAGLRRPRPDAGLWPGSRDSRRCRSLCVAPAHGHAVPERRAAHRPGRLRERRVPGARAHRPARAADPPAGAHQAAGSRPARRRGAHAGGALRRHGAARGAGARHRHGPRDSPLRRAVRRAGSDLSRIHPAAHQAYELSARHHQRRRLARCQRVGEHRRRQLPAVVRSGGRGRHARGAACQQFRGGAPVHDGQRRGPGAVPLSGARLRHAAAGGGCMSNGARHGLLLEGVRRFGAVSIFLAQLLAQCLPSLARPRLTVHQIYNAGARSLIIIMLSGLQGYNLLQRFGSEEALGTAAALGLLRELGPVITALLFAGRAGTALTSEIGLMRATDQLTAMEIMAVDPLRYVAAPRFLGGGVAMPLLVAIFSVVGLFGAQLIGVQLMGIDKGVFWSQTQASVALRDVNEGLVKSLVFGVACSLIAVHEGYHAEPTAEGVGLATTRTVVASSVLVLLLDYVLTAAFL